MRNDSRRVVTPGNQQETARYSAPAQDEYNEADYETCVVKFFGAKDFGFLTRPDGSDAFFHLNQVVQHDKDNIGIGVKVEAIFRQGPKGPVARTVRIP